MNSLVSQFEIRIIDGISKKYFDVLFDFLAINSGKFSVKLVDESVVTPEYNLMSQIIPQ